MTRYLVTDYPALILPRFFSHSCRPCPSSKLKRESLRISGLSLTPSTPNGCDHCCSASRLCPRTGIFSNNFTDQPYMPGSVPRKPPSYCTVVVNRRLHPCTTPPHKPIHRSLSEPAHRVNLPLTRGRAAGRPSARRENGEHWGGLNSDANITSLCWFPYDCGQPCREPRSEPSTFSDGVRRPK